MASTARRAAFAVAFLMSAGHAAASVAWREAFTSDELDAQRWQRTYDSDSSGHVAQIVTGDSGRRLRLALDTRATSDDSLGRVGVVTRCPLPIGTATRLRVRVDWGPPANGSYLSGAVVVSPQRTSGDPAKTSDYLSIEYVGVPPGRNARLLVRASMNGEVRTLFADGWPDANRAGRYVGKSQLEVAWRAGQLEVRENGIVVYTGRAAEAPFAAAYVYLQMTSHSNYAERAIHFDDVLVTESDDATEVRPLPAAPGCDVLR